MHIYISIHIYVYIYIYLFLSLYIYVYIYLSLSLSIYIYIFRRDLRPAAVRCDMVLHQAFRARHVRQNSIGGEVQHGVTSGVSCETF